MKTKIIGDDMQALIANPKPGEVIIAESGSMMYKKGPIKIDANLEGGILGGLKRALMRESIFLVTCESTGEDGEVGFASPYPGHIKQIQLSNNSITCQKDAFLCSSGNIKIDVALTKKLGFGFFGGEGFILQKISGKGDLFIHAGGNFVEMNLKKGESVDVDTGCIVAMEDSISYDIKSIGNIKTSLFAGEGIFVAHLNGPGKIWLQTLPFARMSEKIASAICSTKGESKGVAGFGGKLLKEVLSGK